MEKLADISAFMALQNGATMHLNNFAYDSPENLRHRYEKAAATLKMEGAEIEKLKQQKRQMLDAIKAGGSRTARFGDINEIQEKIDRAVHAYEILATETEELKKEYMDAVSGKRGSDGSEAPAGGDRRFREKNPPQPDRRAREFQREKQQQDMLVAKVKPILSAINSFVQAAGDFHKWYQTAYKFINVYDKEWDVANKSKKDWNGVQMRSNAYMRTHDFKNTYNKLKGYSIFQEPPKKNPVLEWGKSDGYRQIMSLLRGEHPIVPQRKGVGA